MSSVSKLLLLAEQDLENSRLLLENERYRASISRAYYAMYYSTQALLDAKKIASRTHKGMIQQFGQHFVKTGTFSTDTSKQLSDAYDLRQISDYAADALVDREAAEKALSASVEFVEKVRTYLTR
ncbi:MAG: HEPN domain-containing protein [Cyanobacteria bacterium P01_D01_bin.1]